MAPLPPEPAGNQLQRVRGGGGGGGKGATAAELVLYSNRAAQRFSGLCQLAVRLPVRTCRYK
jgi:hypothetical protein